MTRCKINPYVNGNNQIKRLYKSKNELRCNKVENPSNFEILIPKAWIH